MTTTRSNEVAADATVSLALEAAAVRGDGSTRRAMQPMRLATIQRIVRAQLYASPQAFTHFSIFALATAGRGLPGERFEHEALAEHLTIYAAALTRVSDAVDEERIEIADGGFTDWMSRLLHDRHERLLISGAGLDHPALALEATR